MRKPFTVIIVTLSVVCTLKGMSRQLIQRIKVMLLCIEYGILFVNTVDMKIKACNALNAMFVRLSILLSKHIHTFLPITFLICNRFSIQKSFGKLRLRVFQPYHQYYICRYCRYKTKISNAFNAIYVNTVNAEHIHTFLPITFLIFNWFSIRKKFWKAET